VLRPPVTSAVPAEVLRPPVTSAVPTKVHKLPVVVPSASQPPVVQTQTVPTREGDSQALVEEARALAEDLSQQLPVVMDVLNPGDPSPRWDRSATFEVDPIPEFRYISPLTGLQMRIPAGELGEDEPEAEEPLEANRLLEALGVVGAHANVPILASFPPVSHRVPLLHERQTGVSPSLLPMLTNSLSEALTLQLRVTTQVAALTQQLARAQLERRQAREELLQVYGRLIWLIRERSRLQTQLETAGGSRDVEELESLRNALAEQEARMGVVRLQYQAQIEITEKIRTELDLAQETEAKLVRDHNQEMANLQRSLNNAEADRKLVQTQLEHEINVKEMHKRVLEQTQRQNEDLKKTVLEL
jgi:hypothetical protein